MNKRKQYEKVLEKFKYTKVINPIDQKLVASAVKKRPLDIHKGRAGRLSVLAGSLGLTGAAIMAAKASQRCGCGLITLMCPYDLNAIFEIALTEPMTQPLKDSKERVSKKSFWQILNQTKNADAFLIGPGLSRSDEITELVCDLIKESQVPLIIDADGLFAISQNPDILKSAKSPVIITPHIGEFSHLVSKPCDEVLKNTKDMAKDFSKKYGVVVILKSHQTIVALPDGEIYTNVLGNPGMAKGGSGDVLSGAVASFMAQTGDSVLSALAGVYFHSLSADMAAIDFGEYSLLPTDTLEYLRFAIKETYDDVNKI